MASESISIINEVKKQLRLNLKASAHSFKDIDDDLSLYIKELGQVEDLMTRTLMVGESNSCLIVGPRGCGKSTVINSLLDKFKENKKLKNGTVVRLSGLLQTDDRLALKEITHQLCLETAAARQVFNSFAENLSFLLDSLKSGSKNESKSVIFILDEFDMFCHHKNQTLLYNLFDVAQSAQAPICVVGLTCRLDVIELLEKRVKSRFSHRQVYLFPPQDYESSFPDIIRNTLCLYQNKILTKNYIDIWDCAVDNLLEDEKATEILEKIHSINNDVRYLKNLLLLATSRLNSNDTFLTSDMLQFAYNMMSFDAKINLFKGLSILQLCLIIAMKHLSVNYDGEPFNFEMVYREYLKFCQRRNSIQTFDRAVVLKAFDQLQCLEIVKRIDNSKGMQREFQLVQLMISTQEISKCINKMDFLPTDIEFWANAVVLVG